MINNDKLNHYKLSIFSFSCLRRSVLIKQIANAWGDLLVLVIVFCKIDKLTLLNTKLINTLIKINYSLSTFRRCQDSRERRKGNWHLVKRLRRIDVETRLKGYKYFEIERDFLNKLGVLIDGDFKFGVLLLVFVRYVIGDKFRFVRTKLKSR
jgi:hypothetical protein